MLVEADRGEEQQADESRANQDDANIVADNRIGDAGQVEGKDGDYPSAKVTV